MKITDRPVVVFLGAVVGAFVAGVLGLTWLDSKIDSAVERRFPPLPPALGEAGVIRSGDIQIVWGEATISPTYQGVAFRSFAAKFPAFFAAPPKVTYGVHFTGRAGGADPTYAIYTSFVRSNGTSGGLRAEVLEWGSSTNDCPRDYVTVDYIAIGKWR